jgi:hypothetical protein
MTGFRNSQGSYYRCSSHYAATEPAQRCRGIIRGHEADARVWGAILQILDHPELVLAEVAKQQATVQDQDTAIEQELRAVEAALTRCEQDDRRLIDVYVAGAFTAAELKGYRTEVATRRHTLEAEQQTQLSKREALEYAKAQTEALVDYCARVRDRLDTFSLAERQIAFDALAFKVRWFPGEPLRIEASIPFDEIVSQPVL